MNTTYEILEDIVGAPANDIQALVLYMGAVAIAVLVFYFVLYLFKLITGLIRLNFSERGGE